MRLDKLARHFTATYDVKVTKEIERLAAEYGKLKEPVAVRGAVKGWGHFRLVLLKLTCELSRVDVDIRYVH